MDANKINSFLHSEPIPQHITLKVGEVFHIKLPNVPMTRYTEFLQFKKTKFGDVDCIQENLSSDRGEGTILPQFISVMAIYPGRVQLVLRAMDSLSKEEIPDVKPLEIVIEVSQ
jgi:hypothetical protein